MLSPVIIASSTEVSPFITIPSTGIFSPGFTTTISPTTTFSINISISFPSAKTFAFLGCNPISFFIALDVSPFVLASSNFPKVIKVIIIPADS